MKKRMKVLVGYDGSIYADAAIDDLRAAGLPREVEAMVVSVGEAPIVPPFVTIRDIVGERAISIANHARAHISDALADATDLAGSAARRLESYFPSWDVRANAVGGRPATELIQEARGWAADLIVVGSQGRSAVGRFIFGSVSLEVASDGPCSVRIGRLFESRDHAARRIIVGLDGLAGSERAIKQILKRAWPQGTELRIIAVEDGRSLTKTAKFISAGNEPVELTDAPGLKVFAEIKKGEPASVLMTEARDWKADCIFIGAQGFANDANDPGHTVSTQLATNAHCSVEIVR